MHLYIGMCISLSLAVADSGGRYNGAILHAFSCRRSMQRIFQAVSGVGGIMGGGITRFNCMVEAHGLQKCT